MKTCILLICTILYTAGLLAQCTPLGDQTTAGTNDTWIGYVYDNMDFTSYAGYVTEGTPGNLNFDEGFGGDAVNYNTNGCSIYTETFSVRYKLDNTFTAGYYDITVGGDDGYRFSTDGGATWTVNNWGDHGYATSNTAIYLSGLTHLVLEYYEDGGANRISISITPSCSGTEDQTVYGTGGIWKGYIYDNIDFTLYRGMVTEGYAGNPYFDENFGGDYVTYPTNDCTIYTETFSARYRLQRTFAYGSYTFLVGGDDGYRLSFDGGATWPINNWTDHPYTTTSYTVTLNGTYNMVLEYYENAGANRISIDLTAILLPIQLTIFTGQLQNKQVALNWSAASSSNAANFIIERSSNGQTFETIGQVKSNATTQYSYTDASPLTGTSYYRLKTIDQNTTASYSDIVTIKSNTSGALKIYPTVINKNALLNIQADDQLQNVTVSVADLQGRQLQQQAIPTLLSGQKISMSLAPNMATGAYVVQVRSAGNVVSSKTIVVH